MDSAAHRLLLGRLTPDPNSPFFVSAAAFEPFERLSFFHLGQTFYSFVHVVSVQGGCLFIISPPTKYPLGAPYKLGETQALCYGSVIYPHRSFPVLTSLVLCLLTFSTLSERRYLGKKTVVQLHAATVTRSTKQKRDTSAVLRPRGPLPGRTSLQSYSSFLYAPLFDTHTVSERLYLEVKLLFISARRLLQSRRNKTAVRVLLHDGSVVCCPDGCHSEHNARSSVPAALSTASDLLKLCCLPMNSSTCYIPWSQDRFH